MKKLFLLTLTIFTLPIIGALAADQPANSMGVSSYVKLDFSDGSNPNICGGTLISNDIVITASHCLLDAWVKSSKRSLTIRYGDRFSNIAYLRPGQSWIKFDPDVDLALFRMDRSITAQSGARAAVLDTACPDGPRSRYNYPLTAVYYQRMNDLGLPLPPENYQTSTRSILNHGPAIGAQGTVYYSFNTGNPGDSGGSVFSSDNILIGALNSVQMSIPARLLPLNLINSLNLPNPIPIPDFIRNLGTVSGLSTTAALCVYRYKIDSVMDQLSRLR